MSSFLFSKMFDAVLNLIVSDYCMTTIMLIILLVILIWRIYKNYMRPYSEFPTYPLIRHIAYCTIMNKIPKHLPITSFFFQELIRLAKGFQEEGVVLIWLPGPILTIFDKDAVKIFSNDQAVLDKAYMYCVLRKGLGNGLLTSNGATWKAHRKLLDPVFHVGVLKKTLPMFNESAQMLVKKLDECIDKSSIDILEFLKPCAFGNICEYALGLKMNIPENKEIIKYFVEQVTSASNLAATIYAYPWLYFMLMLKFTPFSRKFTKTIEGLHSFTREIISEIKRNVGLRQADRPIGDEGNENEETRKSFAHILLGHHLKDNAFTMEDVENQVITFMTTGYDTVSYALLWTLFMLGHHPEIQDEAYNEVDTLGDENIKYEDLYKLKYLECVIKETLRLYPIAPIYVRKLGKEMFCGKYCVPKGTDIAFFSYLLHRDPEVFPDPEKFDPCRFVGVSSSNVLGSYIPFGEGIRNCIGKRFAMFEMKVILSYILLNFRIKSLDRREDVDLSYSVVLAPVRPLRFQITSRK